MSRFPKVKVIRHQREHYTSRTYDIITFTDTNGATRALFFEIAWEQ